jgi:hypothetical protein
MARQPRRSRVQHCRVAELLPEHFQSFIVALKNHIFINSSAANYFKNQEFLCGPQIPIGAITYGTDPLLWIQLSCKQSSCVKGTSFKASGGLEIPCPEFSWNNSISRGSVSLELPFLWSPEWVGLG